MSTANAVPAIMTIEHVKMLVKQAIDGEWDVTRVWLDGAEESTVRSEEELLPIFEYAARCAIERIVTGGLGYSGDFVSEHIDRSEQQTCKYHGWGRCKEPAIPHSIYCAEHHETESVW